MGYTINFVIQKSFLSQEKVEKVQSAVKHIQPLSDSADSDGSLGAAHRIYTCHSARLLRLFIVRRKYNYPLFLQPQPIILPHCKTIRCILTASYKLSIAFTFQVAAIPCLPYTHMCTEAGSLKI